MTKRKPISRTVRARVFDKANGWLFTCDGCGVLFSVSYNMNRTRAEKPKFCSRACQSRKAREQSKKTVADRFWNLVDKRGADECWPWKGHRRPAGYGWFNFYGRAPMNASRAAYILARGEPGDRFVCHTCDNPPCCNPAHLWLGSSAENTADMDRKGRRINAPARGEQSGRAKLTAQKVRDIMASTAPDSALALLYGVSAAAIYNVRHGKAWAHITGVSRAR